MQPQQQRQWKQQRLLGERLSSWLKRSGKQMKGQQKWVGRPHGVSQTQLVGVINVLEAGKRYWTRVGQGWGARGGGRARVLMLFSCQISQTVVRLKIMKISLKVALVPPPNIHTHPICPAPIWEMGMIMRVTWITQVRVPHQDCTQIWPFLGIWGLLRAPLVGWVVHILVAMFACLLGSCKGSSEFNW